MQHTDVFIGLSLSDFSSTSMPRYANLACDSLTRNMPSHFFDLKNFHQQKCFFEKEIPYISCSQDIKIFRVVTFFAISQFREDAFKFFYEVVSRWLFPKKQLYVLSANTSNICLHDIDNKTYTISEITVLCETDDECVEIKKNFTLLKLDIALGLKSAFYARCFLDFKGPYIDTKTASIHKFIATVVTRFPQHFSTTIFKDMQHFLVMREDEFKNSRSVRHLCRLICIQFLFRKNLQDLIQKNNKRRHLFVKIFHSRIGCDEKSKKVLSVIVGLNFLDNDESFCEKKLLKAIQQYVPSAQKIENTFFVQNFQLPHICLAYIEIEREDGLLFTSTEIRRLRRELPHNLKNRVEHRSHTIFMPRNDEEVMRAMLTLTHQLKYVRDIPQVFITFDEQADMHLYFTIVLARLVKSPHLSIAELFKKSKGCAEYLHDCIRIMGFVRKKYPKEATVFRLKLPKEDFLRTDYSIDLHKARQRVVNELINAVGEIRDYNGGMMSLQHELLKSIRESLSDVKEIDDLLLDNFFYSLSPVAVRSIVDPCAFKKLYLMLLEGLKEYKSGECYRKFHVEPYNVFVLVIVENPRMKDLLLEAIQDIHIPLLEIASSSVYVHGLTCIGCICCAQDPTKKERLFSMISSILDSSNLSV